MIGALSTYRACFARGRRYSLPAYLLGASLRGRCSDAGALAWLRGLPRPRIERAPGGEIVLGDVALYPGVRLATGPRGHITIGDGTYLNRRTLVWSEDRVVIGRDAMIAWDVIISDGCGFGEAGGVGEVRPVSIGDGAWIGAKAVILGGARIGSGAMVAAGAVVSGDVPDGAIVASRPAKLVRILEGSPSHA